MPLSPSAELPTRILHFLQPTNPKVHLLATLQLRRKLKLFGVLCSWHRVGEQYIFTERISGKMVVTETQSFLMGGDTAKGPRLCPCCIGSLENLVKYFEGVIQTIKNRPIKGVKTE
jgi:hypothetical protein